ncbi:MAG: hypothetical protein ACLR8P_22480 [Clostridium fessum]
MVENHPDTRKQEYRGIACLMLPVLFCADGYACTFGGRSAVEKSFSAICGGAVSVLFCFAAESCSYPQGKSASSI